MSKPITLCMLTLLGLAYSLGGCASNKGHVNEIEGIAVQHDDYLTGSYVYSKENEIPLIEAWALIGEVLDEEQLNGEYRLYSPEQPEDGGGVRVHLPEWLEEVCVKAKAESKKVHIKFRGRVYPLTISAWGMNTKISPWGEVDDFEVLDHRVE